MIVIKAKSPEELYIKGFLKLYEEGESSDDPELFKEDCASLQIIGKDSNRLVHFSEERICSSFNYNQFVRQGNKQMEKECRHYYKELITSEKLKQLISYLKKHRLSKRAIVILWENEHRDLKRSCPCLIYTYFRIKRNRLDTNCHMRASDACGIFIMDLHILKGLHEYVANKLKAEPGNFSVWIDSFHFYNNKKSEIDHRYKVFKNRVINLSKS
jgi:thymidylate synthase